MKCLFQLISRVDGERSDPMLATPAEFVVHLRNHIDQESWDDFYVLVLLENFNPADTSSERMSKAPLFTVRSFINHKEV